MFKHISSVVLAASASMFLLSGCSDHAAPTSTTTTSSAGTYIGAFVDAAVAGVTWSCGTASGVTDANGMFGPCEATSTVTFSIGGVVLSSSTVSSLPADGVVTPQDLAGVDRNNATDDKAVAMATFIQSLATKDATTGNYVISTATSNEIKNQVTSGAVSANLFSETNTTKLLTNVGTANTTLVNAVNTKTSAGLSVKSEATAKTNLATETTTTAIAAIATQVNNTAEQTCKATTPPASTSSYDAKTGVLTTSTFSYAWSTQAKACILITNTTTKITNTGGTGGSD